MKFRVGVFILMFATCHCLLLATNTADLQITIDTIQAVAAAGNSLQITIDPYNYTRTQNVVDTTTAKVSYSHNVASEIVARPTLFGDPGHNDFTLSVYLDATGGGNTIYFKKADLNNYSATKLYSSTSNGNNATNASMHIGARNPADSGFANWWKLTPGTYNYTVEVKIQNK